MDTPQPRYLYLVRHAEATADESGLSEAGRRQAVLLGKRLRDVPLAAIHHGPLARAAQTARLVAEQRADGIRPSESEAAGDYVPYEPTREDLSGGGVDADRYLDFVTRFPAAERKDGPRLAARATGLFTGTVNASGPGTSWSSPTTSSADGSYVPPTTHPPGAGSASTWRTPRSP
jgi:probable phosphoglycerate mutase